MQTTKYYIYAHKDGADIIYIGKGCGGRIHDLNRTAAHRDFMLSRQELGDFTYAEFLRTGLTEAQALELEASLIKEHKPEFNMKLKRPPKGSYQRVYPDLPTDEAMRLGSARGVELAKLSPRNGKRGPGKKSIK